MKALFFALILCTSFVHAADTLTINPDNGKTTCTITISVDMTAEKAAAITAQSAGVTMKEIKATYGRAVLARVNDVLYKSQAALDADDATIDTQTAAQIAAKQAEAAARKAARPQIGDPTK